MEFGIFYLPAIGNKSELQEGMAGRRTDLYQRMLRNLAEQAQYLDAHGYYGIGFTAPLLLLSLCPSKIWWRLT